MGTIYSNSHVSNDVFCKQEDKECYQVKTSIFWLCQVFSAIAGEVNSCINYNIYFIFSFHFSLFILSNFCFFSFSFLFFLLFSSYTCMRVWSRTLSGRLCKVSSSFSENMAEKDNQSLHNENNENNRVRTLRDHMNLTRTSAPSCIVSPLMLLILILSQKLFNFYRLFMA